MEKIGASAFEGTAVSTVTLALSELKEVGAYAFKTQTMMYFTVAAGEENRAMIAKEDLKEGEFFFVYGNIVESMTKQYSAPIRHLSLRFKIDGGGRRFRLHRMGRAVCIFGGRI